MATTTLLTTTTTLLTTTTSLFESIMNIITISIPTTTTME